jgi:hypothetical protein
MLCILQIVGRIATLTLEKVLESGGSERIYTIGSAVEVGE